MSVDAGLKQLKVISRGEDGGREGVPVSGGHRDKRVGESARSILIQFDSYSRQKEPFNLTTLLLPTKSLFNIIIY